MIFTCLMSDAEMQRSKAERDSLRHEQPQRMFVFAVFSCRRFDCIQSDTSSRQADKVDWS